MTTLITIALFGIFMCISFQLGVKAGRKEMLISDNFPKEIIQTNEVIDEKMEILNAEN